MTLRAFETLLHQTSLAMDLKQRGRCRSKTKYLWGLCASITSVPNLSHGHLEVTADLLAFESILNGIC